MGGYSGAVVFRLDAAGEPAWYLKAAARGIGLTLAPERARLDWLSGRLPVPQVLAFAEDAEREYLLISTIEGTEASDRAFAADPARLAGLLAAGLRQIHALDPAGCPFDGRLDVALAEAGARVAADLVDVEDFDEGRRGQGAASLHAEALATRPATEDLVFTHGDYCLPNVIIAPAGDAVAGFIDWGRGGLADRYQDLALCARSLAGNFGAAWVPAFFAAYGLAAPDREKIVYYQLLDEFF